MKVTGIRLAENVGNVLPEPGFYIHQELLIVRENEGHRANFSAFGRVLSYDDSHPVVEELIRFGQDIGLPQKQTLQEEEAQSVHEVIKRSEVKAPKKLSVISGRITLRETGNSYNCIAVSFGAGQAYAFYKIDERVDTNAFKLYCDIRERSVSAQPQSPATSKVYTSVVS